MEIIRNALINVTPVSGVTVSNMQVGKSYKSKANGLVVTKAIGGWITWPNGDTVVVITSEQHFASFHATQAVWFPHKVQVHIE